jgi:hypothetical protein
MTLPADPDTLASIRPEWAWNLADPRLKEALAAGGLPVTDEALRLLSDGLITLKHNYNLAKEFASAGKTAIEVDKEISRLREALQTAVNILDDNDQLWRLSLPSPTFSLVTLLLRTYYSYPRDDIERLRALLSQVDAARTLWSQVDVEGSCKYFPAIRKRRSPGRPEEAAENVLAAGIRDLFIELGGDRTGIRRINEFWSHCAALLGVAKSKGSFRKRRRRQGGQISKR